ncbi:SMC family ATPase [Salinimonas marina]|uniref:SMC family ATPase n=1 Tax=Salinimonas marina TaxID=2785918 RepID=A0A7S9HDL8_9ALTE|nr:SMC family ATPase [Salinimonas marina]QPG06350.1 SMC family ATPase [Salinimonas marina]
MKPLVLTMQAFGPFADSQSIDFSRLGHNPLFLINGPTGAGKTSILDALCYALYGETTGNEREGVQMRCDLAAANLPTTVTLDFKLHQRVYRISRSPEQQTPKARGDGFTVSKHKAVLTRLGEPEELLTNKTSQVKQEVVQLIGLTETQFRQVMVLPQGKFRELLLASSKEREDIFGQLFQTDIYKRIEYALKEKAGDITRAKNEFDNQIRGALQVAQVASAEELTAALSQAQSRYSAQQAESDKAMAARQLAEQHLQQGTALSEQFGRRQQARAALTVHLQNQNDHQQQQQQLQRALQARQIEANYQSLVQYQEQRQSMQVAVDDAAKKLEHSKQQHTRAEAELEQAREAAQQVTALTDEQYRLANVKTALQEKQALAGQLEQAKQTAAQLSANLTKYEAFKAKLEQQTCEAETQLKSAVEQHQQRPAVEVKIQHLTRLIKDLTRLSELRAQAGQIRRQTKKADDQVGRAVQTQQQAQTDADTAEMHWHSGQAAALAQKLQDQMPCPVCGSKDHPQPAVFSGQQFSKAEVQQARQRATQAQEHTNRARAEHQQYQQQLMHNEELQQQLVTELEENAEADIPTQQAALEQQQQRLEALQNIDIKAQEEAFETLKQRCIKGEQSIGEVNEQKATNEANLKGYRKQYETLSQNIDPGYSTVADVDHKIEQIKANIAELNKALEQAGRNQQQTAVETSANHSTYKANQQYLEHARQQLTKAMTDWQQTLKASSFNDDADFEQARLSEDAINELQQQITGYTEKQLKLEQTLSDLDTALAGKDEPDIAASKATFEQAEKAASQATERLNEARSQHQQLEQVQKNITRLREHNSELETQYRIYGTLYDVTSGKTGSRVSLHRFVLGVLLDDVLIQASQRLALMSKGRYRLIRKLAGFKGAAGRGLDLEVEDSYTSRSRDVATLSGGESFMAALALALGLSDVVQSYSGGIRLETLFIDEGFGSLDPESLDLAIQTLVDLQQSGRTIGVISHVSELKEQMAQRIEVIPSRQGSKVTLAGI